MVRISLLKAKIIGLISISALIFGFEKVDKPLFADTAEELIISNSSGTQVRVVEESADPTLRVVLPGQPSTDRSIEILFPEHVTVRPQGKTDAYQLYMYQGVQSGVRPTWRKSRNSLEYEKNFPDVVRMLARATLEEDGIRFHFEFSNLSDKKLDLVYAPIDPRLTAGMHDVRLERTYVHHKNGFELLASETPARLTMPLDQWLPARYLDSFTWPIPANRAERRNSIMYYNKSRAVDAPFIATVSQDQKWVIASFTYTAGNVWSNPELTCQHVDSQAAIAPGEGATLETKMIFVRGSLEDAFKIAMREKSSLKH